jgi:hypothetical protein
VQAWALVSALSDVRTVEAMEGYKALAGEHLNLPSCTAPRRSSPRKLDREAASSHDAASGFLLVVLSRTEVLAADQTENGTATIITYPFHFPRELELKNIPWAVRATSKAWRRRCRNSSDPFQSISIPKIVTEDAVQFVAGTTRD